MLPEASTLADLQTPKVWPQICIARRSPFGRDTNNYRSVTATAFFFPRGRTNEEDNPPTSLCLMGSNAAEICFRTLWIRMATLFGSKNGEWLPKQVLLWGNIPWQMNVSCECDAWVCCHYSCAAMVQGLVLFKVKQISRKKEQMHGFYLQLKNILTTFPKKIS